jgi:hypothetical protein
MRCSAGYDIEPLSGVATVPQFKKRSETISLIVSRVAFKIEVRQKAAAKPVVYHMLRSLGHIPRWLSVLRCYLLRATATFKISTTTAGPKGMCHDAITRSEIALSERVGEAGPTGATTPPVKICS